MTKAWQSSFEELVWKEPPFQLHPLYWHAMERLWVDFAQGVVGAALKWGRSRSGGGVDDDVGVAAFVTAVV